MIIIKAVSTMKTTKEKILSDLVERIRTITEPEQIILFGSQVNGETSPDSDYDLCVLKQNVENRRRLSQTIYKALYGCGVSVDVIVETSSNFDDLKENPHLIYSQIAQHGLTIYDRSHRR